MHLDAAQRHGQLISPAYTKGPADRDHPLTKVIMVPVRNAPAFSERFGVDVYTVFNMTEISSPIISAPNPPVNGSCGKKREGASMFGSSTRMTLKSKWARSANWWCVRNVPGR